jgi:hypothetical protein
MAEQRATYVAECFWTGVTDSDLERLDRRIELAIAELAPPVRYLGAILMREDEVVLCQFEGTSDAVRAAATRAAVPYARIVETALSLQRGADDR